MMALNLKRFEDWLINGKTAVIPVYQPDDQAAEMAPVDAVLAQGLGANHLASGAAVQDMKFLSFDGVDGSGLTPDLSCILVGAQVGDTVAGILDGALLTNAAAAFESVITVADEIQQVSLADLSGNTYMIVLYAKA
jgi:hypothetical protein